MTGEKSKPNSSGAQPLVQQEQPFWPASIALPQVQIAIVGLGPGPVESLTLAAWRSLTTAARLLLRTARHPCVAALPPAVAYTTFDELYAQHTEFAAVYRDIAHRVVELGRAPGGVVYAVPGHPWVGEATTPLILETAAAAGLSTAIIDGLSFVAPCFAAAGVDLMDGSQVVDAMLLARQHHPKLDPGLPLLVGQVYSRRVASDLKLTLLNAYPDEHPVQLLHAVGGPEQQMQAMPLYALDHHDAFNHLTSLYVPPLPAGGSFSHLQEIVAHLRAPEGCPWDRVQTLDSLKQDLLGECVEVLEAIDLESVNLERAEILDDILDSGDDDSLGEDQHRASASEDNSRHIAEELGDLLLVTVMLIQIATEEGRFKLGDVTQGIVEKLIRRHPHVFGSTVIDSVGQVLTNWDAIKAAEKEAKGRPAAGPLDGIPAQLPALEKARTLQSKAEKAGLLRRAELAATAPALFEQLLVASEPAKMRAWGELLWGLAALAHTEKVNAEDALRAYAAAYRNRSHAPG